MCINPPVKQGKTFRLSRNDVLLTWNELIAKIEEVKKANVEDTLPSFTDAITQVQALSKWLVQLGSRSRTD